MLGVQIVQDFGIICQKNKDTSICIESYLQLQIFSYIIIASVVKSNILFDKVSVH